MRQGALAAACSFLFVPGDRPERYRKALDSGADAVIVDLEDAVAPTAREPARQALAQAWPALAEAERARVLVRINAAETPWHDDDLRLARMLAGLGGLVVPKAEGSDALAEAARACPAAAVLPLVESGRGLDVLDALTAVPGVVRLGLGHIDLMLDLGMACGPDEEELVPARWSLVRASRRAGLAPPVDGVTPAIGDAAALSRDAARSRRAGFGGKLCIHPSQVAGVHAAWTPSGAERAWAARVVAAAGEAAGGVCRVDGTMVDAPVIAAARRVLALCERADAAGWTRAS